MTQLQVILDAIMCLLWIATYTLCLIGSIRYRYPLLSLNTQAVVAPLEISVLLLIFKMNAFRFDYASIAYLYWVIIEIVIMCVTLKNGKMKKKQMVLYILTVMAITAVMIYGVTVKEYLFMFNYFNTTIGILLWLIYLLRRKDYPIKPISWAVFSTKLAADILAFIVYHEGRQWQINLAFLPMIDVLFLLVLLYRWNRKSRQQSLLQILNGVTHECADSGNCPTGKITGNL